MISIGANRMPQIGLLDDAIFYAQAYSGHGVNATHMAANIGTAINSDSARLNLFGAIPHRNFPGGKMLRSPCWRWGCCGID